MAFARALPATLVLVPGLTDNSDDVAQIARFARELGNVERVQVLPFHQMGRYTWAKLKLTDILPPSSEEVERISTRFRACGVETD